jgi:hypothetical protein
MRLAFSVMDPDLLARGKRLASMLQQQSLKAAAMASAERTIARGMVEADPDTPLTVADLHVIEAKAAADDAATVRRLVEELEHCWGARG